MGEARRLKPRLPSLLGREELEALHVSALQVLETVGLHVADENCLRALEGHPGLSRQGSRLHFEPEFVHAEVERHRARTQPPALEEEGEPELSVGSHATHYVDLDTDDVRPLDWAACETISRSVEGLRSRGLRGSCPGAPQEVPPGLREVAQALLGWEHCRDGGVAPATTLESVEYLFEMNGVMGRGCGVGVHLVSPLRLEGIEYEMAVKFAPRGVSVGVGSMPIMGVTAPIFPAGAFVIAVAEVLGSWIAVRLFLELDSVGFSFDAYSVDMRSGGFIFGNPEQKLLDLIKRDVNAFYHVRKPPRAMYTMARRPGAQSCAEMAALGMVDALSGCRHLWGVNMAVDELCSVEQYVLSLEMMHSAMRLADGVEWDPRSLAVEVIRDVCGAGGDGNFLVHDSTLDQYREVYWLPELWDRRGLAVGAWGPLEPARERAKQIARQAPGWSDFRLDEGQAKALRDIYQHAVQRSWPT